MKIPKKLRGSIIEIADKIIVGGIDRCASTIIVHNTHGQLRVFERDGSLGKFEKTGRVKPGMSTAIFTRLKAMCGMSTGDDGAVQVAYFTFKHSSKPRIRKRVRVLSVPNTSGKEELIIDLVP